MFRLPFIFALTAVSLMAGCSRSPLDDARSRIKGADIGVLRFDAAKIYKQVHAAPGPEFVVLKPGKWPESFKKLKPLRVGVYRDGIAFALGGESDSEWGIHVFPTGMTQIRTMQTGRFEKITDGVFWYSFKH